jgi:hypothetical protein
MAEQKGEVMAKRKALSTKVRFEVFKRDGFSCAYCGATPANDITLEVDHIVPVSKGGKDDMSNLITSCFKCNRGKGAKSLGTKESPLTQKIESVSLEQLEYYQQYLEAKQAYLDSCGSMAIEEYQDVSNANFSYQQYSTIKHYIDMYGVEMVLDSIRIAGMKEFHYPPDRFKYICGIINNKVKQERGE